MKTRKCSGCDTAMLSHEGWFAFDVKLWFCDDMCYCAYCRKQSERIALADTEADNDIPPCDMHTQDFE